MQPRASPQRRSGREERDRRAGTSPSAGAPALMIRIAEAELRAAGERVSRSSSSGWATAGRRAAAIIGAALVLAAVPGAPPARAAADGARQARARPPARRGERRPAHPLADLQPREGARRRPALRVPPDAALRAGRSCARPTSRCATSRRRWARARRTAIRCSTRPTRPRARDQGDRLGRLQHRVQPLRSTAASARSTRPCASLDRRRRPAHRHVRARRPRATARCS